MEYGSLCPLEHLAERVADYMHAYTLYSAVRPFGAAVLLSSWSKVGGAQLYMIDPAGLGYAYHGCAIGKAKQAAKTEIEKLKLLEMTPEVFFSNLISHPCRTSEFGISGTFETGGQDNLCHSR